MGRTILKWKLQSLVQTIVATLLNKYDYPLTESEIYLHDLNLVLGIEQEECLDLIEETLEKDLNLVKDVKQVLDKIKEENEIYILTARSIKFKETTIEWLRRKSILYDKILFLNEGEKYSCNEHFDIIIEDCLKDAINWKKKVKNVIIFDRPWNKTLDVKKHLIRVKNWTEIFAKIEELKS